MSLEAMIEANTAAILKLIEVLESKQAVTPAPVVQAAPVVQPAPMPTLPTFTIPAAPAAPVNAAPFADSKGLIAYVMEAYKLMGPEKGAKIQGILVSLGYQNINDVKPEHYGAFYVGVEALK